MRRHDSCYTHARTHTHTPTANNAPNATANGATPSARPAIFWNCTPTPAPGWPAPAPYARAPNWANTCRTGAPNWAELQRLDAQLAEDAELARLAADLNTRTLPGDRPFFVEGRVGAPIWHFKIFT